MKKRVTSIYIHLDKHFYLMFIIITILLATHLQIK